MTIEERLSEGDVHATRNEDATTKVSVEYLDGGGYTVYLEPGDSLVVGEDGPALVEAFALPEDD